MTQFLAIQSTYYNVDIGIFAGNLCLDQQKINKIYASKNLALTIHKLLKQNKKSISDIDFFGVNRGPGPFTTLRVVIASMNGLSFASNTPLVAVDGFSAFMHDVHSVEHDHTIILLNAFNNDVYFAYADKDTAIIIRSGVQKIDQLLLELKKQYGKSSMLFVGNGTLMHRELIAEQFGKQAYIPEHCPEFGSLDTIAKNSFHQWQSAGEKTYQIMPRYIKSTLW